MLRTDPNSWRTMCLLALIVLTVNASAADKIDEVLRTKKYKLVRNDDGSPKKIADGATATTYECSRGTRTYAVKVIDAQKLLQAGGTEDMIKLECLAMVKLKRLPYGNTKKMHPNIVEYKTMFESEDPRCKFMIVQELLRGGELMSRGRLPEPIAAMFTQQLASALNHMHQNRFVHLDFKPENVLLKDDKTVKVIDFGTAVQGTGNKPGMTEFGEYPMSGTPDYQAPEMMLNYDAGSKRSKYAGREVDMWALGVTVYMMLTGRRPFSEAKTGRDDIRKRVMNMEYTFPDDVPISDEAKDLVARLLTGREERLTAEDALRHPWIQKFANPAVTPQIPAGSSGAASPKSAPKGKTPTLLIES